MRLGEINLYGTSSTFCLRTVGGPIVVKGTSQKIRVGADGEGLHVASKKATGPSSVKGDT